VTDECERSKEKLKTKFDLMDENAIKRETNILKEKQYDVLKKKQAIDEGRRRNEKLKQILI
jgi:hypothetical protein